MLTKAATRTATAHMRAKGGVRAGSISSFDLPVVTFGRGGNFSYVV